MTRPSSRKTAEKSINSCISPAPDSARNHDTDILWDYRKSLKLGIAWTALLYQNNAICPPWFHSCTVGSQESTGSGQILKQPATCTASGDFLMSRGPQRLVRAVWGFWCRFLLTLHLSRWLLSPLCAATWAKEATCNVCVVTQSYLHVTLPTLANTFTVVL